MPQPLRLPQPPLSRPAPRRLNQRRFQRRPVASARFQLLRRVEKEKRLTSIPRLQLDNSSKSRSWNSSPCPPSQSQSRSLNRSLRSVPHLSPPSLQKNRPRNVQRLRRCVDRLLRPVRFQSPKSHFAQWVEICLQGQRPQARELLRRRGDPETALHNDLDLPVSRRRRLDQLWDAHL